MFLVQSLPGLPAPIDPDKALVTLPSPQPLGKVAKNKASESYQQKTLDDASRRAAATVDRFALQDRALLLVPWERVARCCRYVRKQAYVEVMHSASTGRAHYSGLEICGSVWLCPVCAARIAELRRRELVDAVAACEAGGGAVLHLTFTVQHSRQDNLKHLVKRFQKAFSRLVGHRTYRQLIRPTYGIFGTVRALEVTHGENGWHPHNHVLVFLSRPLTEEELGRLDVELRALWARSAALEGLSMNQHGLTIRGSNKAAATYVAKWGVAEELTRAHIKKGRGTSLSPWDMLRASAAGDKRCDALWREFAAVFKGRQQLVWSPGLRAVLGLLDAVSDEEAANALPDDARSLFTMQFSDWLLVVRYRQRGQLLNVAAAGSFDAVYGFIAQLREWHAAYRLRRGLDKPPVIPPKQLAFAC